MAWISTLATAADRACCCYNLSPSLTACDVHWRKANVRLAASYVQAYTRVLCGSLPEWIPVHIYFSPRNLQSLTSAPATCIVVSAVTSLHWSICLAIHFKPSFSPTTEIFNKYYHLSNLGRWQTLRHSCFFTSSLVGFPFLFTAPVC